MLNSSNESHGSPYKRRYWKLMSNFATHDLFVSPDLRKW